ncbi:C-type lectin domain family 10 member A-like [Odontesthes bonariensis]|uniref:C-type lectin domain family 10 member A n=1 Tax=Odontesthes bonariensis TaxID=219752 RepID=UPI003F58602E
MESDYRYENEMDGNALWIKEPPPVPVPGESRIRRWGVPALLAAALLVLCMVLGATNVKASNRLWSAEQRVSDLSDIIQSLNASLQHAQETVKEVQQQQLDAEHKALVTSGLMSAMLKYLSLVDSLSRSVAALKCSVEHIINNSSAAGPCCPMDWTLLGSSCYRFSRSSLSWNESRNWCESQNAHLVILNTDKEWDFVTQHSVPEFYWVGLSDWRTGKWEWVNQTPYTVERRRWVPGQPDNWSGHDPASGSEDCAHLHSDGRLNDLHCTVKMRFICQKHSVHI